MVTEKKIKDALISSLLVATPNTEINIAMFYLSNRDVVRALLKASDNGADIKIVLDSNKDAFGHEKGGIPNRQVASELVKKSEGKIKIRWYDTHGEQFHRKLIFIKNKNKQSQLILGSANLTRRNIGNYNLETNVVVRGDNNLPLFKDLEFYFDLIWDNQENKNFTVDYSVFCYQDDILFE